MTITLNDIYQALPLHERIWLAVRHVIESVTNTDALQCREQRFADITKEYSKLIASICLSFANSNEDFDDLRQDTYLNIWKGLDGFRQDSSLSTWIYRVTLNTCVSFQRKSTRKDSVSMADLFTELYDNSTPEEIENYRIMYSLIEELKPLDKSLILMWLDSKSYEDIAAVSGLTKNAVSLRLKRAKEKLTQIYNQKYN